MSEQREALARAQAELVAALADGAPLPEGFDPERAAATAEVLARKRERAAVRAPRKSTAAR